MRLQTSLAVLFLALLSACSNLPPPDCPCAKIPPPPPHLMAEPLLLEPFPERKTP